MTELVISETEFGMLKQSDDDDDVVLFGFKVIPP
jgi:hypothetical protein